jgi:histidinol-phosphate aminotransferase
VRESKSDTEHLQIIVQLSGKLLYWQESILICPYSEYKDDGTNILLDANENAYGPGLNLDANGRLVKDGATFGEELQATDNVVEADLTPDIDLLGLNRYPDP